MEALRELFERWAEAHGEAYSGRQWLLSKWDVEEGIDWPDEKVRLMAADIRRKLALRPGLRILDAGCGGGWILKDIADGEGFGLDLSLAMLRCARRIAPDLHWVRGDAERLPFRPGAFHRVLCYFVLMNFPDPDQVDRIVSELARAVAPGGILLLGQLPLREGAGRYDAEKARYLEYWKGRGTVGRSLRTECRPPIALFDAARIRTWGLLSGFRLEIRPAFNHFWREGEPLEGPWRVDAILTRSPSP